MDALDWNLVRAFQATARAGSLTAAARRLGLAQPTLSRQIAALEAALGATLFDRIGKRLVLTATGAGLLDHAEAMAVGADALALAAAGRAADIGGRVTISAVEGVAAYLLPPVVARIRREAPQILVHLVASDSLSDLRRREADIAIRHVRPSEPELIGRRLGDMAAHFYAADSWLASNRRPERLEDLLAADLIGFEPIDRFVAHLNGAGLAVTPERFRLVSENAVVLWEMVRQGLGVGITLAAIGDRTPGVARVLPNFAPATVPVWLVSHREMRTARRVRLVFDILAEELAGVVANPA